MAVCHAQDETYQTKIYTDNGGDRFNVKSGGTITVFSGGDLDLKTGSSLYYNAVKILGATTYLPIASGGSGTNTAAGAASAFGVGTEDSPTFTGVTATTGSTTSHVTTTGTITTAHIVTANVTTSNTTTDNITNAAITSGTVTGTLNVQTTFRINGTDTTKAAAFTDNQGSKMDSGALALVSGSQTVTTSLVAVDRVFYTFDTSSSGSATSFRHTKSGASFTVYGYDPVTGATSTSAYNGDWHAIDE